MNIKIKTPHFKIVEQMAMVMIIALIIPMFVAGFIVNNINQQAVRAQLKEAATLITNIISDEIDVFNSTSQSNLNQIVQTLDYFPSNESKIQYITKISNSSKSYKKLLILNTDKNDIELYEDYIENNEIPDFFKMKNGQYLVAIYNIDTIKNKLFNPLGNDQRQIYILSHSKKLIASYNYNDKIFNQSISQLPTTLTENSATIFGRIKNQPFVYLKKDNPKVIIVVSTPSDMTKNTIETGRTNIILSILIATLTVLFIVGMYTYYLYINIRQLFKAIIAISKGNYNRQIRLLTNLFTPYEVIFLASEFNKMISQISKSYSKLKKSNKELKELNEFRSNMIDTVSHEFRTPLTSIQGYTSRLLRQDIEIDKETQQKSLKVIKKQSERLKRMIEDLLVIPDIEDKQLNIIPDNVYIPEVIEDAILLVKNSSAKTIINNIESDLPNIYVDRDRFEQIIINLIENAIKYAKDDTEILITAKEEENKVIVEIKNKYSLIPREKLKTLFDKFTRIDDKTTRTTRGTGLGLYIVKGLTEAMNGEIRLYSNEEYGFIVKLYFEKANQ